MSVTKSNRIKLDEWEFRLHEQVGEGELLLGELGYIRRELDEIGSLLANTVFSQLQKKRYTIEKTLHFIRHDWPLTFALYLVLEGIYCYDSEEQYWHGPMERLWLKSNQTHLCGRLFLEILTKYDLPTFDQTGGYTYVTPILLHGGIPNDFLDNFFDFLWRYEVQPHRVVLDSQSLLQLWRSEPDMYLMGLPRPVQRFLKYGGVVSEDFVSRCLDLFHTDSLEEATALVDLPIRVIKAYWKWREEKGIRTRPFRSRVRLQKPVLSLAPYTTGVGLYLPPQQFPSRDAPRTLTWHVKAGDNFYQTIPTIRQRIESGYHYAVTQEVSIPPASDYSFRLDADGETLQTWALPGVESIPIFVFAPYDDYDGDALAEQERFRPGERWLLYPQEYQWQPKGGSKKVRDLPRLSNDWQNFKLEVWQFAPGELVLQDENGREYNFFIAHEKVRQKPYFLGGNRIPLPTSSTDFPLYVGSPPELILHVRQPHRWHIAIRVAGDSQPSGLKHYRLSHLRHKQQDGVVNLELALTELLGKSPIGKFEIVLRGPLGQSFSLGLRVILSLEVDGLNQVFLGNCDILATLEFRCDPATEIRQNPPQENVDLKLVLVSKNQKQYKLEAQPEVQNLTLQLKHAEGVIIPLTIPIYRLRWGLSCESENKSIQWQTRPSTIFPGSLVNAEVCVDVPIVKDYPVYLGWQLVDSHEEILREVQAKDESLQRRLKVPMGELLSVWRECRQTLCWQLVLLLPDYDHPLIIPAFYLIPTLDFGEFVYEWQEEGPNIRLSLAWEHLQRGNYYLRLWPLDRPWIEEPIGLTWPETAVYHAEWQIPQDQLPIEAYLAEVVAFNPWQSSRLERPQPQQPNTILIKPPGLEEHYQEIFNRREQGQANIEQLLALLAHQFYNNQKNEIYQTNKIIADQADTLPITWLVRWANTIKTFDAIAYKTVQFKLFLLPMIERLAKIQTETKELEQYCAHLPNDFPEKVDVWILQSGLHTPRQRCLEKLCRIKVTNSDEEAAFLVAMQALLDDVSEGSMLVNDGVDLLIQNFQLATDFLIKDGGQDAKELLYGLMQQKNTKIDWIGTGMMLDCQFGQISVERLRHRVSSDLRFCINHRDNFYVEGKLFVSPTAVSVRLDLRNMLVHFNSTEPYQCRHCNELFSCMADYARHHESAHPDEGQSRKRLKRNEKLKWVRPIIHHREEALQ